MPKIEKTEFPDLGICPEAIKAADPNAEVFWPVLLKKVGLHLKATGEVIENDGYRAAIVRRFGTPSLAHRLSWAKDKTEVGRARIWWRESIACSEGDSNVPDLAEESMYVLNAFIVTPELKFADPRVARMAAGRAGKSESIGRGRPVKSDLEKRLTTAARQKRFREAKKQAFVAV